MAINDPSDISGLRYWFDSTDETTISKTGDNVTEWRSKSGSDHLSDVSAVDSCQSGTVSYNGENVIQFSNSGTIDQIDYREVALPNTIACYLKPDAAQLGAYGEFFGAWDTSGQPQMWCNSGNTFSSYDPTHNHSETYSTTAASSVIFSRDTVDDALFVNNVKENTGFAGTQKIIKWKLGNNRANIQPYFGWVGQVVIYSRAITDQEASDLHDWMAAQYPATSSPPYSDPPHEVTDAGDLTTGLADPLNIYYGQSPATELTDQFSFQEVTTTNGWAVTIDAEGYPVVDTSGETGTDTFKYQMSHDAGTSWDGVDGTWTFTVLPEGGVQLTNPRTDTVTPTGAKLYITANVDTGTTYWAVFDEPSAKTPAEIITPTGAADSGNAPAQLTEDEFTATGLDTEANRYYVWYAHTDSTAAVSGRAFGASASADTSIISSVIGPVIRECISGCIGSSSAGGSVVIATIGAGYMFNLASNSQYLALI